MKIITVFEISEYYMFIYIYIYIYDLFVNIHTLLMHTLVMSDFRFNPTKKV